MAFAPHPVARQHRKESGTIFMTLTPEIFTCINELPSQSSLLQTKQAQLPQGLLRRQMLQTLPHLCGLPLDPLQQLLVFLVLRSPHPAQVLLT